MAIMSFAYYESLKRYWKRKKYKRTSSAAAAHHKKKLKIVRLGGAAAASVQKTTPKKQKRKQHLKMASPVKLLAKFHDAYAGVMICLANKVANSGGNGGLFRGRDVAKPQHVSSVSSGEAVDSKLLLEIYKKMAAARQLTMISHC